MADIAVEKMAEFVKSRNVVVLKVVDYKSIPVGNLRGKKRRIQYGVKLYQHDVRIRQKLEYRYGKIGFLSCC